MAKARKHKLEKSDPPSRSAARGLRVYRTPIGFHDAYVAVRSQKAALEAWGSDSNLFAAGAAERVDDPELTKVPLERPGEVIKVLRGTRAEQVAALGDLAGKAGSKEKSGFRFKSGMTKTKKPSRAKLDAAEEALEAVAKQHAKALAAIDKEIAGLERKRRELERRQRRELAEAEEQLADERRRYEREFTAWRGK